MAKTKFTFEFEEGEVDVFYYKKKLQAIARVDDYINLINFILNESLRYKHKEDGLIEDYGEKSLDLIDEIRSDIISYMDEYDIPFE